MNEKALGKWGLWLMEDEIWKNNDLINGKLAKADLLLMLAMFGERCAVFGYKQAIEDMKEIL